VASYLIVAALLLGTGGGGIVGVVELREDHIGLGVLIVLLLVDDAAPGEGLLPHDAELDEFAVAGLEDVVVVDGEEVGRGRGHIDLVVVWLWGGSY
jgi:hypothetical protein